MTWPQYFYVSTWAAGLAFGLILYIVRAEKFDTAALLFYLVVAVLTGLIWPISYTMFFGAWTLDAVRHTAWWRQRKHLRRVRRRQRGADP